MGFGLLAKRLGGGVEGLEYPSNIAPRHAQRCEFARYRRGARAGDRPEAAVASAIIRWADRTASGVRDRPEARRPMRDHDADNSAGLAVDADAVIGDCRLAPDQERL